MISALDQSDIPTGEENSIQILADGIRARCFIRGMSDDRWQSDKIVIVFDEKHLVHGEYFMTKNFRIDEPGILQYGYDGQIIRVQRLIID